MAYPKTFHWLNRRQVSVVGLRQKVGTATSALVIVIPLALGSALLLALSNGSKPSMGSGKIDSTFSAKQVESQANHPASAFSVQINRPAGPPRLDSGTFDSDGKPILVECSMCHTNRSPNFDNRVVGDLKDFHRDLQVDHGSVSCLSCHNPDDYQSLRLADGKRIEFSDVMQLCGQCHGPQMRDYEHGVHGGMNGHWDLRFGPQFKNNCVDCHTPHHPQFPHMRTGFKPQDRFLNPEASTPGNSMHE